MVGPVTITELPRLREDLRLVRGGPSLSGAPSWVIHDPAANKFYQIPYETYQLLALWNKYPNPAALMLAVAERHGRAVEEGEIIAILQLITGAQLTQASAADGDHWRNLYAQSQKTRPWYVTLSLQYLFFKVPLLHPQEFLSRSWPHVRPLFSRGFAALVVVLGLIGLYMVSRQWDTFMATFPYVFTWEGLMISALSVIVIKSLHELGHAYLAHRYGCHVPAIGVAFMAFTPMLYTDVTDAWKLASRRQRLMIDLAGIMVELAIGMLALFLWSFLPDGALRSAVFVAATVSWFMSLLVNLSPLMRFDGYFILSDFLGIPNLQDRAFSHMRYRIRRLLFAADEPPTEYFSPGLEVTVLAYAVATTIYRLVLYFGLALLVYHFFFKALGVILFAVEIVFFIILPVWRELKVWWFMRHSLFILQPRTALSGAVALGLIALFFLPVSATVRAPALLEPANYQRLFADSPARVTRIAVANGQSVRKGDTLIELEAPQLAAHIRESKTEIALRELRLGRGGADAQDLQDRQVIERQLASFRAQLDGLEKSQAKLVIRAEFDGVIKDVPQRLYPGKWVARTEQLGLLAASAGAVSRGFVSGDDLSRISAGAKAVFVPEDLTAAKVPVTIAAIAPSSSRAIDLLPLTSVFGGRIAVTQAADRSLAPVEAQYGVNAAAAEGSLPDRMQRGVMMISARGQSMASRVWRQVMRVLVREAGA